MSTSRILPIINLAGCLLITGLILAQWLKERVLDEKIVTLHKELISTREQYEAEHKRASALDKDVIQLKEAIESTMQAKNEVETSLAKITSEHDAQTAGLVANVTNAAQEQTKVWEKAVADRDEVIRKLNANLTATRSKLDEAVIELKKAGAQ